MDTVSAAEAARQLGMSRQAVVKAVHAGRLRGSQLDNGSFAVDRQSVEDLKDQRGPTDRAVPAAPATAGGGGSLERAGAPCHCGCEACGARIHMLTVERNALAAALAALTGQLVDGVTAM